MEHTGSYVAGKCQNMAEKANILTLTFCGNLKDPFWILISGIQ